MTKQPTTCESCGRCAAIARLTLPHCASQVTGSGSDKGNAADVFYICAGCIPAREAGNFELLEPALDDALHRLVAVSDWAMSVGAAGSALDTASASVVSLTKVSAPKVSLVKTDSALSHSATANPTGPTFSAGRQASAAHRGARSTRSRGTAGSDSSPRRAHLNTRKGR
jgi:hypothetical protein